MLIQGTNEESELLEGVDEGDAGAKEEADYWKKLHYSGPIGAATAADTTCGWLNVDIGQGDERTVLMGCKFFSSSAFSDWLF